MTLNEQAVEADEMTPNRQVSLSPGLFQTEKCLAKGIDGWEKVVWGFFPLKLKRSVWWSRKLPGYGAGPEFWRQQFDLRKRGWGVHFFLSSCFLLAVGLLHVLRFFQVHSNCSQQQIKLLIKNRKRDSIKYLFIFHCNVLCQSSYIDCTP